jgi:hypothetical protein
MPPPPRAGRQSFEPLMRTAQPHVALCDRHWVCEGIVLERQHLQVAVIMVQHQPAPPPPCTPSPANQRSNPSV